jgi:hypothetical protein
MQNKTHSDLDHHLYYTITVTNFPTCNFNMVYTTFLPHRVSVDLISKNYDVYGNYQFAMFKI